MHLAVREQRHGKGSDPVVYKGSQHAVCDFRLRPHAPSACTINLLRADATRKRKNGRNTSKCRTGPFLVEVHVAVQPGTASIEAFDAHEPV